MVGKNYGLNDAKVEPNDEFYTQMEDIESEMRHYWSHFHGKVVYCNCDDPTVSNFFGYFARQFEHLGLKRLVTTCYKNQNRDLFSNHDCETAVGIEFCGEGGGAGMVTLKAARSSNFH